MHFEHLHPTPFLATPTSGNHKSNLFFYEWVCIGSIIDLKQHCVSSYYRYFCTFQNDRHHHKSSYNKSPYKDIAWLLTRFPTLYVSYPWFIYSATRSLYLLTALIYVFSPPPSLWQPPVCSLYIWFCFCFVRFVHFLLKIPHISEFIQYLSFSLWLTSLSTIHSRPIRVIKNGKISLFSYGWVVFHWYISIYILNFIYLYILKYVYILIFIGV